MSNATQCPCGNATNKANRLGGPKKYCSDECKVKYLKHGTDNGYRLGCRCDECRTWKRGKCRIERRKRLVFVFGQCQNETCAEWFTTTSLARSRMYCSVKCTHQDRHRRNYAPYRKGQRSKEDVVARISGHKQCFRCKELLPEWAFNPATHTSDRLSSRCRRCHSDAQHGLSPSIRKQLLAEQCGRCAICDNAFDVHGGGRNKTYAIDHDHTCCPGSHSCGKCIRGLLCARCNKAIGLFSDDQKIIQYAVRYLTKTQKSLTEPGSK